VTLLPNGPKDVEDQLKRFYYDTAFVSSGPPMAALTNLIAASHIVLGTDFPYAPGSATTKELAACGVPANVIAAIERQSALPLVSKASLRA
jgi:hypothetical protein